MIPCSMVSKYPQITSSLNIKWHTDAIPEDSTTNNVTMDSKTSKTSKHVLDLPVTVEKIGNSYEIINITGLEWHQTTGLKWHQTEHPNMQSELNQLQSESWHSKATQKMEKISEIPQISDIG